ncbi:MAG TPA: 4-(cytidine 5'-diphospho)-2-C-methyl-D-erythritol kinase, partial [Microlunatus sp.]|nr:4-(cytidine 5'-diphospho)-2-C-methyl-D-erythritol kinase [Microlunatus sp.]
MSAPISPVPAGVRVRVPAKINLALCVGAPRADGFHPLATVYQAVSLFDEVHAAWGDPGEFTVTVTGEGAAEVPTDDRNLAVRAARLLADRYGEGQPLGVVLAIHKAIPVAGGLAGGSADGAAALLACADLWALDVSLDQMLSLAAELGSDVPFALVGGTALGTGRGEVVVPAMVRGDYWWVVAASTTGLSTPDVYREFDVLSDGLGLHDPEIPDELMEALRAHDLEKLALTVQNDLEAPALRLRPALAELLTAGMDASALGALLSGSGPTCLFLCRDKGHAQQVVS